MPALGTRIFALASVFKPIPDRGAECCHCLSGFAQTGDVMADGLIALIAAIGGGIAIHGARITRISS